MSVYNNKKERDEAVDRITEMEELFCRVQSAMKKFNMALDEFSQIISDLQALKLYYSSEEWKRDFQADENAELPSDLKRGVLSEDGIWNLLENNRELAEIMKKLSDEMLEE